MKIKKSILLMCAILISSFTTQAQEEHEHHHGKDKKEEFTIQPFEKVSDSVKTEIGNVLAAYYLIKNALVASDEDATSKNAKAFRKTLELVNLKNMTSEQNTFFGEFQTKLDYDAEHIQGAPSIDHMREHFSSFSDNMWSLVKAFNATNGVIAYLDYCSMYNKGANWISSETAIKNPYFGKQMLTCGKVTETIK